MNIKVEFNDAAFDHRIEKEDILNALNNKIRDISISAFPEKNLIVGFDRAGNPLEILYNPLDVETINNNAAVSADTLPMATSIWCCRKSDACHRGDAEIGTLIKKFAGRGKIIHIRTTENSSVFQIGKKYVLKFGNTKNNWYLFYHDCVPSGGKTWLRSLKVTELKYNEDGTIQTIKGGGRAKTPTA